MALAITVNGGGTFSASMEEGPVSFTASLGAVPGPKGDTGATGPAGVVSATAPITYDSGTQTIGISATPTFTSVTAGTFNATNLVFSDGTQTTAFVGEARKGYIVARNNTGSTIAAGKVVYLSGATGNKPTVALALASGEATSDRTIGLTVEAIANNADGKVIISGAAENIDTSAFNAGDVVYLSASVAGGMTTTLPTQPYHGVVIGVVTRANPTVGSVEVAINNYQELQELSDVLIASKANLDLLSWDSASGTWQNKTFATLGLLTSATAASTYAPIVHTHTASQISDSTTAGRALLTAADASAQRTSLGLGTMATETAANYAPLASPTFTGDPKAPTPATSDNDTSVATTAFVNAYCPTASTTAAGKVELATVTEAMAGTSATLAVTPAGLEDSLSDQDFWDFQTTAPVASTSGTGAATAQTGNTRKVDAPTSAAGNAILRSGLLLPARGVSNNASALWGKRYSLTFRCVHIGSSIDANSVGRVLYGKGSATTTAGLAVRGFGIEYSSGNALKILAHNGTTLTTYSTSHTVSTSNQAIDVKVTLAADGTVECFVNGSSVGSTSGGPSSGSNANGNALHIEAENTTTITGTAIQFVVAGMRLHAAT